MKYAEITSKNEKQLHDLLAEKRHELHELRFRAAGRELRNVHAIKQTKEVIARILTALKQKQETQAK